MTDAAADQIAAWRSVAPGWEQWRALFWDATHLVSERLVANLRPAPGETILELAAGPGDTGFLAAPYLEPGGRLISSDVVAEMVDAARRRAAQLGVENVEFRVLDAAAVDLPDASVDGILCRFGLMLVVDVEAAFGELARVLPPGGRAAVAVWADPGVNDWITAAGRAALELGLIERPERDEPGPFRLSDEGRLRSLAEGAGLHVAAVEDVPVLWRAGSSAEWWKVICHTSRLVSVLSDRVGEHSLASVRARAEGLLAQYTAPDGSLEVPGVARVALLVKPEA